ncbi:hypothetical protein [Mesorhizobium sp.]|uniref:hypothetical protein n=1 Tax=Mesorhizobium sp. TaxID=1871066 RepID=UPI000FE52891|nr:hypothetical protein [Mesorhizobium sp.]RWH31602.1 MAG: hypothetical protein EOQ76_07240 [Mesorhizobium sp.]TIR57655.1 MAG: hypothetical protein E5X22_22790 [Mesorhizobium sp.]
MEASATAEAIEALISTMTAMAKDWSIETFASRAVGLLILDEGNLNKYQRTLEIVLEVHARVLAARSAEERALLAEVYQIFQNTERHEGSLVAEKGTTLIRMQLPDRVEQAIAALVAK